MLTIHSRPRRVCSGLTRRELLQIGGAGLFGLSLPRLLAAEQAQPAFQNGRAKSVLFLYLFGGPSQLETFDMKPDAPSALRGPFKPIASRTPDLRLCEHLARTSQVSDKFCTIRTMTHPHNDHNACHYIQTGHAWTRSAANGSDVNARETDWPAMGSVVEYLSQRAADAQQRTLPDYVYLPNNLGHLQGYDRTGQYAGWLGAANNALATDIHKREKSDNPYFRDCTDAELDFRIKGAGSHRPAFAGPAPGTSRFAGAVRRRPPPCRRGGRVRHAGPIPPPCGDAGHVGQDSHGARYPARAGGAAGPIRSPLVRSVDADGSTHDRSGQPFRHRCVGTRRTASVGIRITAANTWKST